MEEPNTFGHPSAPKLYANVECRLLVGSGPPRLVLRKVYDGTGGQSHAVHYEGDLSWDGRTVNGNWRIGATTGRFSLTKY